MTTTLPSTTAVSDIAAILPSVFMCPIVGSIALRLLIIARSVRVMPRFCPDLRTCTPSG